MPSFARGEYDLMCIATASLRGADKDGPTVGMLATAVETAVQTQLRSPNCAECIKSQESREQRFNASSPPCHSDGLKSRGPGSTLFPAASGNRQTAIGGLGARVGAGGWELGNTAAATPSRTRVDRVLNSRCRVRGNKELGNRSPGARSLRVLQSSRSSQSIQLGRRAQVWDPA